LIFTTATTPGDGTNVLEKSLAHERNDIADNVTATKALTIYTNHPAISMVSTTDLAKKAPA
ncbi:hypothetical protein, partial [Brevibacillus sp. SIMBA_040]|uniref:hypothetical protein n=1 Tax=Brevibacillus sp. SIMBA_040 TaxID=3085781 RepID=UPI00397BC798